MDSRILVVGGLVLLLLLGCVRPAEQKASGNIGDSDISPGTGEDSDLLPQEDLIPAPGAYSSSINDSDLEIDDTEDSDVIVDADILEPI